MACALLSTSLDIELLIEQNPARIAYIQINTGRCSLTQIITEFRFALARFELKLICGSSPYNCLSTVRIVPMNGYRESCKSRCVELKKREYYR